MSCRYVPVLHLKEAEQNALRHLTLHERLQITPLVIVPASRPEPPKRPEEREPKRRRPKGEWIAEVVSRLGQAWGDLPVFVLIQASSIWDDDFLASLVARFAELSRWNRLKPIMVAELSTGDKLRAVVRSLAARDGRGMCIRLSGEDLQSGTLQLDVARLVSDIGLAPSSIDLVVDLGFVKEEGYDLTAICGSLPSLHEWRTVTVAGGALPKGVGECELGFNERGRHEWTAYEKQARLKTRRNIQYGDYTTVHPVPYDPNRHPAGTASIRYTTEKHWLIMKGQKLSDESRYRQFPANALLLVDLYGKRLSGDHCCFGDKYLHKMADRAREGVAEGRGSTGNSTTWLTASINHHLTYVVLQLAKMSAS